MAPELERLAVMHRKASISGNGWVCAYLEDGVWITTRIQPIWESSSINSAIQASAGARAQRVKMRGSRLRTPAFYDGRFVFRFQRRASRRADFRRRPNRRGEDFQFHQAI